MKLFYGPIWAGRVVLLLFYYKRELAIGVLWSLAQCECVCVIASIRERMNKCKQKRTRV